MCFSFSDKATCRVQIIFHQPQLPQQKHSQWHILYIPNNINLVAAQMKSNKDIISGGNVRQAIICSAPWLLFISEQSQGTYCKLLGVCPQEHWEFKAPLPQGWWMEDWDVKRKYSSMFTFYELSERIHGCSACRSGLGSQDKHVALASVIRNTKLVFGSFSARYILESKHAKTHII